MKTTKINAAAAGVGLEKIEALHKTCDFDKGT